MRFVHKLMFVVAGLVAIGAVGMAVWPIVRSAIDPIPPELDTPEMRKHRRLFPYQPLAPKKVRYYSPPIPKHSPTRERRIRERREEEAQQAVQSPLPATSPADTAR